MKFNQQNTFEEWVKVNPDKIITLPYKAFNGTLITEKHQKVIDNYNFLSWKIDISPNENLLNARHQLFTTLIHTLKE